LAYLNEVSTAAIDGDPPSMVLMIYVGVVFGFGERMKFILLGEVGFYRWSTCHVIYSTRRV